MYEGRWKDNKYFGKEIYFSLTEKSMKENSGMINFMVRETYLALMGKSTKESGRMVNLLVMGPIIHLMRKVRGWMEG